MILGPKELLKLVKKINLVENLDERELKNPEGAGFDLRLGEIYKIEGEAFLGIAYRETPKIKLVAQWQHTTSSRPLKGCIGKKFIIKPGEFYLVTTIEKINLPQNLCALLFPRTTLFRSGLFLRTGVAQPGYSGKLTFALKNEGPATVTLELGCRFVHAIFLQIKGATLYRGQWQGGRITTSKKEKQI